MNGENQAGSLLLTSRDNKYMTLLYCAAIEMSDDVLMTPRGGERSRCVCAPLCSICEALQLPIDTEGEAHIHVVIVSIHHPPPPTAHALPSLHPLTEDNSGQRLNLTPRTSDRKSSAVCAGSSLLTHFWQRDGGEKMRDAIESLLDLI